MKNSTSTKDTAAEIAAVTAAQFVAVFLATANDGGKFVGSKKDRRLDLGETVTDTAIINREQWLREYMATEIQKHWNPKQPKPKKKARKRGHSRRD